MNAKNKARKMFNELAIHGLTIQTFENWMEIGRFYVEEMVKEDFPDFSLQNELFCKCGLLPTWCNFKGLFMCSCGKNYTLLKGLLYEVQYI